MFGSRMLVLIIVFAAFATMAQATDAAYRLQSAGSTADPASAAIFYSQLEAEGRFSELYQYMHPDARAIIPEAAVVGWYRDHFAPLGPGVISVTDARIVAWTWGVTGITYPMTAEVSFTQPFDNAPTAHEVVRLVEHEGQWSWFFGRSREFVGEQISTYVSASVPSSASCDGAEEWWADTFPRLIAADYGVYTMPSLKSIVNGTASPELLRDYQAAFGNHHAAQSRSVPPQAASAIHQDLLAIFGDFEFALGNVASVVSGNMNPMTAPAVLANGLDTINQASFDLANLEASVNAFLDACDPTVAFVYGMGEDLPIGVLPGQVGPGVPSIDCTHFDSQDDAQQFFEAAGADDPHQLDEDGDGVACG